ncbi:hypothetical protein BCR44DRAFT_1328600 [Catenaria anguillulae PL171]|uniref:Uncharacterized protein n=1 Tax=Catenaria anguillulae PL171 TaxID=765915 RepID=A0A1Y2H6R4_9FUNG|nr:hypothetical protein BCR44DRAFT_1328600 [Catenaria anguillulae PL171]
MYGTDGCGSMCLSCPVQETDGAGFSPSIADICRTWCITTGWASWAGRTVISVVLSVTITMFVCYIVIFLRIRRVVVAKSKTLVASEAHSSVLATSTRHVLSASSSAKDSGSSRQKSLRGSGSASSLRSAFAAAKASSIKLNTNRRHGSQQMSKESQLQRRIAMRGALALISACLNFIPILIVCIWTTITSRRADATLSATVPLGIFLNAILDPVIAMSQDKILRRAVLELFWIRAAPKDLTESSQAAMEQPQARGADGNQFVSVFTNGAPSVEESHIEQRSWDII